MEYSKDIILGVKYVNISKKGQANVKRRDKIMKLIKKHKFIATISTFCGILIMLDYMLIYNFITLLQKLA